jgi:hypothetical protein
VAGWVRGWVTNAGPDVVVARVSVLLSRTAASETPMQTNANKAKINIFFFILK